MHMYTFRDAVCNSGSVLEPEGLEGIFSLIRCNLTASTCRDLQNLRETSTSTVVAVDRDANGLSPE
jgi:hypothetical protein